mgnify:CR=1 FL=1
MIERFSRRYNYCSEPEKIIYEEAPEKVRASFWNLVNRYVGRERLPGYVSLYACYADFLGEVVADLNYIPSKLRIKECILERPWYEFYDLCQYTFEHLQEVAPFEYQEGYFPGENLKEVHYTYTVDLNRIFQDARVGWRLKKGRLERISSEYLDREVIDRAQKLLEHEKFAGPNAQFQKAIDFFSKMPEPDIQNTIKEAVGALEAIAKILENKEKADFGKLIPILVRKGVLKKPLDKCFTVIYAFRGKEPGVAHGEYKLSELNVADAELILNFCAAGIVFLGRKYKIELEKEIDTEEELPF